VLGDNVGDDEHSADIGTKVLGLKVGADVGDNTYGA
jgi:hypothetical protein